ncbi:TolC family protein [Puia sp.]|jgi:outer membrane protein|uniref:TolC family protein n=1 Tax=Puia sp. TaxID=2045100 RepID=UPI002F412DE3
MRYLSFSFLLLSFALCTGTLEAQYANNAVPGNDQITGTLTLQQAVAIAMKNNLAVNNSDLGSQQFKIQYDQSWEYMLPTLSASGGQSINFGRSISSANNQYSNTQFEAGNAGLNAGLVLFRGLQYQNGLKASRYAYQASKMDLQQQRDNVTLNVLLAYLQVLSNRDLLALAIEQSRTDSVQLERQKVLGSEGDLNPLSGLTDLQGQYAGDQVGIAQNVNNLENSKVALFALLNVPYNREVEYQNSVTTTDISQYQASPDSIFRKALSLYPNIESARLKELQYTRALAQARGAYYPTVSLNAGVSTTWINNPAGTFTPSDSAYQKVNNIYAANGAAQYQIFQQQYTNGTTTYPDWWNQFKNNRGENIGISVQIPILNGFQARNNVRLAKLNLENSQINKVNARNFLQQQVENAFQNMVAAYKSYKFYAEQAKAFEESFRITNIRFTEGVITSDIYIQAKYRSDVAEVNLAAAKYIYIFRTKVLDYYQGRLDLTK